jgi:hypothetical protein
LRTEPKKTVAALKDGVDGGLEQSFFLTPDAMRILRQALVWIERQRGTGAQI